MPHVSTFQQTAQSVTQRLGCCHIRLIQALFLYPGVGSPTLARRTRYCGSRTRAAFELTDSALSARRKRNARQAKGAGRNQHRQIPSRLRHISSHGAHDTSESALGNGRGTNFR